MTNTEGKSDVTLEIEITMYQYSINSHSICINKSHPMILETILQYVKSSLATSPFLLHTCTVPDKLNQDPFFF